MNIGLLVSYDSNAAGVGYYGLQLLKGLPRADPKNNYFGINVSTDKRANAGSHMRLQRLGRIPRLVTLSSSRLETLRQKPLRQHEFQAMFFRRLFYRLWRLPQLEIIHSTLIDPRFLDLINPESTKIVMNIHDLILEIYPQWSMYWNQPGKLSRIVRTRRRYASSSDIIVTLSKAMKSDVVKHFRVRESKVVTVPAGCRPEFDTRPKPNIISELYGINEYILAIGTIEPRKNYATVIRALKKMQHTNMKLVIVGQKGWLCDDVFRLVKKEELETRVIFTGYLPYDKLPEACLHAKLYVFPSLFEPSAWPVIDAMACGIPSVASDIPYIREFAEGAAELVPPLDEDLWASAMDGLLDGRGIREERIRRGLEITMQLSERNSALKIAALYTSLCE